jgi:outer membrane lipoprotein-sorting protein
VKLRGKRIIYIKINKMGKSIFILLIVFYQIAPAQLPDPGLIMNRSRDLSLTGSMSAEVYLSISERNGSVRQRTISMVSKTYGDAEKRFIEFLSPPDIKGTAMLIIDNKDAADEMWIYLPALKRTRRISSSEKGKSFMSSEFTNADMSSPALDDFSDTHLAGSGSGGKWIIESRPVNDNVADDYGYSRKVSHIDQKDYHVRKMEFYDFDNKLFKVISINSIISFGEGRYMVDNMTAENLATGRKSAIEMKNVKTGNDISDAVFTIQNLGK